MSYVVWHNKVSEEKVREALRGEYGFSRRGRKDAVYGELRGKKDKKIKVRVETNVGKKSQDKERET